MLNKNSMWEILVPASTGKRKFSYEHHKEWDAFVKDIAGGITVFSAVKGEWINTKGRLFRDRMIPVRISCSEYEISKIIDFTIKHYNQEAVLAYKVSDHVILRYKE